MNRTQDVANHLAAIAANLAAISGILATQTLDAESLPPPVLTKKHPEDNHESKDAPKPHLEAPQKASDPTTPAQDEQHDAEADKPAKQAAKEPAKVADKPVSKKDDLPFTEEELTRDLVRKRIMTFAKDNGRKAVLKLLEEFEAPQISDLDKKYFKEVIEYIDNFKG